MRLEVVSVTEWQGNFSAGRAAAAFSPHQSGPFLQPLHGRTHVLARALARLMARRSPTDIRHFAEDQVS